MIREFLGLVFVTSLLVASGIKGLSCPGGEKGPGGNCLCSQALGKDQGQWEDPFCHQGLCIIQQLTSGDHCKAKPMGLHGLKDGTWCWNKKRQSACPTDKPKVCSAGKFGQGGSCPQDCSGAPVKKEAGTKWMIPWCGEGVCFTGQASGPGWDACQGKGMGWKGFLDNAKTSWCYDERRDTVCPFQKVEPTSSPVTEGPKKKPTNTEVWRVRQLINKMFSKKPALHPAALRLTFHDCVGDRCDGCVNLDQEDNRGLEKIIETYEGMLEDPKVKPFFTRADLWALGGVQATMWGAIIANTFGCKKGFKAECTPLPDTTFEWGRKDCPTAPKQPEEFFFPTVNMTRREMLDFFETEFGFNAQETTALMGAHNLGKCRKNRSGFDGSWTILRENYFNNGFHRLMRNRHFEFSNDANFPDDPLDKKFQFNVWYHKWKLGMFLNTDMHFFYDIEGSNMLNGTRCRPSGADYGHSGDVLSKQCGKGPWGNGGVCDCSLDERNRSFEKSRWWNPWCVNGLCITGQEHGPCKNKPMGYQPLGDGTWCWDRKRQRQCARVGTDHPNFRPVCGLAPKDTRQMVDRYGKTTEASKKAFMEDFARVLRKMMRHGYGNTLHTIV